MRHNKAKTIVLVLVPLENSNRSLAHINISYAIKRVVDYFQIVSNRRTTTTNGIDNLESG